MGQAKVVKRTVYFAGKHVGLTALSFVFLQQQVNEHIAISQFRSRQFGTST